MSRLLSLTEAQTLRAVCLKEEERKENGNCTSVQAAFNVPLENQLVIKRNKTLVVDMLEWEKLSYRLALIWPSN